ncbi:MAG: alpha/beta fold hydrolase [Ruegeria sp.]
MVKVILVHGMNGTADSWYKLPAMLLDAGYETQALDLPGHDKTTSFLEIFLGGNGQHDPGVKMQDYVQSVASAFPVGSDRDVVLIGHSMGGAVISHVAKAFPSRIAQLIYVAAMLPDTGQSVSSIVEMIQSMNVPFIRTLGDFSPHFLKMRLVRQPTGPLSEVFSRTPDFDALPRGYVLCEEDDVIPARLQKRMIDAYATAPVATVQRDLPLSHFPQFDDPQALFAAIRSFLPP